MTLHPMSPEREAQLLRAVASLGSHQEALAFRDGLSAGPDQMTNALLRALRDRIDLLAKREGRT